MGRSDQYAARFATWVVELKLCRRDFPTTRPLGASGGQRRQIILLSCAVVCADGPKPDGRGRMDRMEKRGTPHGRPGDYAIQDRDGTRFSQGGSARTGNRRGNEKVLSRSRLRKREARLLASARARALVENAVHGRKIRGPRDLQEAR